MDNEIREFINNFASDIIKAFDIDVPIKDIQEVVEKLGGSLKFDDSLGYGRDGKIEKDGDSFVIIASPYQTEERLNFTIAHEIGHLFLHMGYRVHKELWNKQDNCNYYRGGSSEKEYQANEFAAAFLMPENKYKEIMDKHTTGKIVHTGEIAREFNVSPIAATNRGKWLGYLRW